MFNLDIEMPQDEKDENQDSNEQDSTDDKSEDDSENVSNTMIHNLMVIQMIQKKSYLVSLLMIKIRRKRKCK